MTSKCITLASRFCCALLLLIGCSLCRAAEHPPTFCNPLNLDYRFQLASPSRREAADPVVLLFDDEYWLFASKSGGYWHSPDCLNWTFVDGSNLPIEDYAPAAAVINGRLYYTAFATGAIYRADNPRAGAWTKVADSKPYRDPALFQDNDGRTYMYYGCGPNGGISGVELDPANGFKEIDSPVLCLSCDPERRGWEVTGDDNSGMVDGKPHKPWIEGSWMTRNGDRYYLQYAAPGAQYRSYADGVFVSNHPLGPFTYAAYSPFSHKSTGFIGGAGHSSTFQDKRGNWWHVTTMSISVRHMFERRIGLFPAGFTPDGQMYCDTRLGDYPLYLPGTIWNTDTNTSPGWMLLSRNKSATASSATSKHPIRNAFDEDVRTWWSAESGKPGEWLQVDLGNTCRIEAVQVNFTDEGSRTLGKLRGDSYQYYIQVSDNGESWRKVLDRSDNHRDMPHDYNELEHPATARYVRLVNIHCPVEIKFSVSDFRLFGNGLSKLPSAITDFTVKRDTTDPRHVTVEWPSCEGAEFYIVRYGVSSGRLFENSQIYDATRAQINSLNTGVNYYFTIDAVNSSGIARGKRIVESKP